MRVFLSYRRQGGSERAQLLEVLLQMRGHEVFLDRQSLSNPDGYFDTQILRAIEAMDNFLLILSPGALDRCADEGDWVRREICHALRCGANIIPVMLEGFRWPEEMPMEIQAIRRCHAHSYYDEYRDACIDRICSNLKAGPARKVPVSPPPRPEAADAALDLGAFPPEDGNALELRTQQRIVIPYGYTSLRKEAFSCFAELTSIAIPRSVTRMETGAFKLCPRLTGVTVPEGVTEIAPHLFSTCPRLTNVTLPQGITAIGEFAFAYCRELTDMALPRALRQIDGFAFLSCDALRSVRFPEGLRSIGRFAFQKCTSLREAVIPDSVTSIGVMAFEGCTELRQVSLPGALRDVGQRAFPAWTTVLRRQEP